MYAHTQTFLPEDHGRSIVQDILPQFKKNIYIYSAFGGKPRTLAHMLDSLVRVSRRDDKKHFVKVSQIYDGKLNNTYLETSLACRRKLD